MLGEQEQLVPFAQDGVVAFAGTAVAALLGFLLTVVVTRQLGAGGAGLLFESVAIFAICCGIAEFGAAIGLVRFIPRLQTLQSAGSIPTLIRLALPPPLIVSVAFAAVLLVFAPQLAGIFLHSVGRQGTACIRVLALFLPLATALTLLLAAIRGFGKMLPFVAVQHVVVPGLRPLLVIAVVSAGLGSVAVAVAWALPLAIGAAVAAVILVRHTVPGAESSEPEAAGSRRALGWEFWRFSAPRALAGFFQVAMLWFDVLLVGALVSTRDAGIYAATNRYIIAGSMALSALDVVTGPRISRLLAAHRTGEAQALFRAGTWWLMALSWPVYLTLGVFASFFMRLFGPGFEAGSMPLLILSIAMLVNMATGNNKTVLLMGGGSGLNLLFSAFALAINVSLNLVLIPAIGIIGAAIAWSASIAAENVLTAVAVWRRLGLNPFGVGYSVVTGAALVCFGGTGLVVRSALGASAGPFLLFGLMATASYAIGLWRFRQVLHLPVFTALLKVRLR